MTTTSEPVWRNWARNQRCAPCEITRPTSEQEVVATVERAAAANERVKVVGAGHSFTDIACTDGHLIDLSRYGRLLGVDRGACRVTVQSGISLARLNDDLAAHGLALENLGDIAYQSIAGATATATHGTGVRFRNLSSAIVGMRLVCADGSVLECSADDGADVLDVARVSLGALGVVSTLTLQCVPAFNLHAVEEPMPVDDVLEDLDAIVDGCDHFEFLWVPHTRWALTKRNRRTDEPVAPRPPLRAWRDDVLYQNVLFGAACRLGRRWPSLIPRLASAVPGAGRAEYVDHSARVFASPRLVRFLEMEYSLPRPALPEAFKRLRDLVDRLGQPVSFPVEVRWVARDEIPLSTAFGDDRAYVAVHLYRGTPTDRYFPAVEAIMRDYDGRPHWGKLHSQHAASLAPLYPRWDDFCEQRARLDPRGRFSNPYLDRVLGPL